MNKDKAETIAYAIRKEYQRSSLLQLYIIYRNTDI